MIDDDWWWLMMTDDDWWWLMMTDDDWGWWWIFCLLSDFFGGDFFWFFESIGSDWAEALYTDASRREDVDRTSFVEKGRNWRRFVKKHWNLPSVSSDWAEALHTDASRREDVDIPSFVKKGRDWRRFVKKHWNQMVENVFHGEGPVGASELYGKTEDMRYCFHGRDPWEQGYVGKTKENQWNHFHGRDPGEQGRKSPFDGEIPSPRPPPYLPPRIFLPRACSSFPTGLGQRPSRGNNNNNNNNSNNNNNNNNMNTIAFSRGPVPPSRPGNCVNPFGHPPLSDFSCL